MGDPQDGFLFTRAPEAPARALFTPSSPEIPNRRGSRKTQPAGPMFLSSESPPASWTRIPGRDPGSSLGGGRNRLPPLRRSWASPSPSVRTLSSQILEGAATGPGGGARASAPLLPRRSRVRGLLPVEGGRVVGVGARRSRAWLAQRPWGGPRRSSQAPSASSAPSQGPA